MNAVDRVSEIERKLVAIHARDPYHSIMVAQLAAIARTAIRDAKAAWRRYDAPPAHERLPDLFMRD